LSKQLVQSNRRQHKKKNKPITGTTSFQVSVTSGNELSYNEYSDGVSYIPSDANLETNKVISKLQKYS
jgi:hypothetical protein